MKKINKEKKETLTNKKPKGSFEAVKDIDFTRASSSMECTGLIPTPPTDDEEQSSYLEIYDYSPEVTDNPREKDAVV